MSERDLFEFFADVGRLYRAQMFQTGWKRFAKGKEPLSDHRAALSIFLGLYAYKRQIDVPDYPDAASEAIFTASDLNVDTVWRGHEAILKKHDTEPNPKTDPLAPKRPKPKSKQRGSYKAKVSLLDVFRPNDNETIIGFIKSRIERRKVREAYSKLNTVNGVGPKIASLFLEDVASYYNLLDGLVDYEPDFERELLQPVDRWIERIGKVLVPSRRPTNRVISTYIVKHSLEHGVSPELFNQGAWFFASQVAESKIRFYRAVDELRRGDEGLAREMVNEYVVSLSILEKTWLR